LAAEYGRTADAADIRIRMVAYLEHDVEGFGAVRGEVHRSSRGPAGFLPGGIARRTHFRDQLAVHVQPVGRIYRIKTQSHRIGERNVAATDEPGRRLAEYGIRVVRPESGDHLAVGLQAVKHRVALEFFRSDQAIPIKIPGTVQLDSPAGIPLCRRYGKLRILGMQGRRDKEEKRYGGDQKAKSSTHSGNSIIEKQGNRTGKTATHDGIRESDHGIEMRMRVHELHAE